MGNSQTNLPSQQDICLQNKALLECKLDPDLCNKMIDRSICIGLDVSSIPLHVSPNYVFYFLRVGKNIEIEVCDSKRWFRTSVNILGLTAEGQIITHPTRREILKPEVLREITQAFKTYNEEISKETLEEGKVKMQLFEKKLDRIRNQDNIMFIPLAIFFLGMWALVRLM